MASPVLRSATVRPDVAPFVAPSGQFVFTPLALNISDGVARVEMVEGTLKADLTQKSKARGYKTIEEVADTPEQAKGIREYLAWAYMRKLSGALPANLMPAKLAEMRAANKRSSGRVPFPGASEPVVAPPRGRKGGE